MKEIKTNEVCLLKYSTLTSKKSNNNATIVFIFFNFFISFNSPKK